MKIMKENQINNKKPSHYLRDIVRKATFSRKSQISIIVKYVKGVFREVKDLGDFVDDKPWIPEGTMEGFHALGSGGRVEQVRGYAEPSEKVTDMRGDWDPGLYLLTDVDRDNGNNVISPSRLEQSIIANQ